jgi:misacylated tRNA(Ala) deacylase|tara:strand:- start:601 stop:1314 length:714 start_codon:yes stop_codon:yes gene_type:complete
VTEKLYLRDVSIESFDAIVQSIEENRVELNQTAFYVAGGGQPHDTGLLKWDGGESSVEDVRTIDGRVWHQLGGELPQQGITVTGFVDQVRRHQMMRTHTAMHILCGVMWQRWQKVVTGGNMDALSGRMDFELDEFPQGFAEQIEDLCNAEIAADRPVAVSFLQRSEAVLDRDLIRTKVNLIPDTVDEIRVVDIVGLDKQADGGTHVASTGDVGRIEITKTESKGRGFKRVRFVLHDD